MRGTTRPRGQQGATLPRVRAISRAVAILRAFTAERPQLALNEVARATDLDAGTTRRILVTLRDEGLIHQDPASGLYSTSTGLLELARAVPDTLSLASLVESRVSQLARDSQTTIYLSAASGDQAICLARQNGGQPIEVRWWAVGEERPYNLGTGPRVLYAHLPDADRQRIGRTVLKLARDEAQALREETDAIRAQGYLVKHDEIAAGLSAMALPLFDDRGNCIAAISSGGLTPRYLGEGQAELLAMMQGAARDMQAMVRGISG